ncbi:MAG: phosphoribosyltransferase family protein, partial [Rhodospirillaceae bacterium]
RHRRTPPQVGLTGEARHKNVSGAFLIRERHGAAVRDAHILLVDDVMTTGATLAECARVLVRGGAARVDVLTLARAVKAE